MFWMTRPIHPLRMNPESVPRRLNLAPGVGRGQLYLYKGLNPKKDRIPSERLSLCSVRLRRNQVNLTPLNQKIPVKPENPRVGRKIYPWPNVITSPYTHEHQMLPLWKTKIQKSDNL